MVVVHAKYVSIGYNTRFLPFGQHLPGRSVLIAISRCLVHINNGYIVKFDVHSDAKLRCILEGILA